MDKYFIITVDTEGDNLWSPYQTADGYREITTENARYLQRFQILCEQFGFKPTYLTNYEMALDDVFLKTAKDGLYRGTLEIGMHLHAWNSPPLYELPYNPKGHNPYAGEYPYDILEEKMTFLTDFLKKRFECDIVSHRGGRWFLDDKIANILCKLGYRADCTVTPGVTWSGTIGNSKFGNDYSDYPDNAFDLAEKFNIPKGKILEVPMTISNSSPFKLRIPSGIKDLKSMFDRKKIWLRPNGHNLYNMLYIVQNNAEGKNYLEFMIHSSELMPGGSPNFKTNEAIEVLYSHIRKLFSCIAESGWKGATLKEYAKKY